MIALAYCLHYISDKKNMENFDPLAYCEHIQSEMKKAQHRVATKTIEQEMTQEQKVNS